MLIAIISDTHDNLATIDIALEKIKAQNINTILHCGDLCNQDTAEYLAKNFDGVIYTAYGNACQKSELITVAEKYPNLKLLGREGEFITPEKRIGFCHYPDLAKEMALSKKYDIIFYGHTHQPWEEKIGEIKIINPGTLAGLFNPATFAYYNTTTNQLQLNRL